MRPFGNLPHRRGGAASPLLIAALAATATPLVAPTLRFDARESDAVDARIMLGRELVLSHACSGCHSNGGVFDPGTTGYLAGASDKGSAFSIGEMTMYPRNLTPDDETGIGRYSERQLFNALRYGLNPAETPDVDITSSTPGKGNFPAKPVYMGPPMPWGAWRHMSDEELWSIAAYLKRAIKPVRHQVPENRGRLTIGQGMQPAMARCR